MTWACEHFNDYLTGTTFHVQTDHKPLVSLLSGAKSLDALPPRIQRFRMRLMKYTFTIAHVPGKDLTIADTLSRAPTSPPSIGDEQFVSDTNVYVDAILQGLPATHNRLEQIKQAQQQDAVCSQLMKYCQDGWPDRHLVPSPIKPYVQVAGELTVHQSLLLRGSRIVIPSSLQLEVLEQLHSAHQGIQKCRQRAQQSVWWLGLSSQLADVVNNCTKCCKDRRQPPEPLNPSTFPSLPWQKVGTDLFHWKGSVYLLIVDYYSRYIETAKLSSTSSSTVIQHIKSIFARHGIPQEVVSDNGPQYSSREFHKFADNYGFKHTTSSPKFPQSNGEAERAVQTVKCLLKKAIDPYMALLTYRATPLANGYSPAELLMSRRLRTDLPALSAHLMPSVPDYLTVKAKEQEKRKKQKDVFDKRHAVQELDPLLPGEQVWIPDHNSTGTVVEPVAPRSYNVSVPTGILRRNRVHLHQLPENNCRVTRSGRVSKPPTKWSPDDHT